MILQVCNVLLLALCLLSTGRVTGTPAPSSLQLLPESLAPYVEKKYELDIDGTVKLKCPKITSDDELYTLYFLSEEDYDTCNPHPSSLGIGDCEMTRNTLFLVLAQHPLPNEPRYERGGNYFYGLFRMTNGTYSREPCVNGTKFSLHIPDPNAPSPTPPTTAPVETSPSPTPSLPNRPAPSESTRPNTRPTTITTVPSEPSRDSLSNNGSSSLDCSLVSLLLLVAVIVLVHAL